MSTPVPPPVPPAGLASPSAPDHVTVTVAGLDEVKDPARQTFVRHLTAHGQELLNEASRLEEKQRGSASPQPEYVTDHFESAVVIMRTPYAAKPPKRKYWWWLLFIGQGLMTAVMTISAAIGDDVSQMVLVASTAVSTVLYIVFGIVGGKND